VSPITVQVRDNDFSIARVEPIMRAARRRPALIGYGLTTTGVVDPAAANDEANYSPVQPSHRRTKIVAIQSIAYDAATETFQLTASAALKSNTFYQLTVNNNPSPGDSFTIQIGVGTTLSYVDGSGDTVGLRVSNGSIVVTRDTTGEGQSLNVFPTSPTNELSGTVRRPRRGTSDSLTTFRSMLVEPGRTFTSTLMNPPFRIGPLRQATIDELLTVSGGTLAGILVTA
jgi:hypothetical protein